MLASILLLSMIAISAIQASRSKDQMPINTPPATSAGIHFDNATATFHLQTRGSSYIFCIDPSTLKLVHLYWGSRLSLADDLRVLDADYEAVSFDAGPLNGQLLEYGDFGTGDFRSPAFQVQYMSDGSLISPHIYQSHSIIRDGNSGYLSSGAYPHFRHDRAPVSTLVVELADPSRPLTVQLRYSVFGDHDAITRSVTFRNGGTESAIDLLKVSSLQVDFPQSSRSRPFHLTHLSGSWARERHLHSREVSMGTAVVESRRGASSHQHNPFVMLSEGARHELEHDHFAVGLVHAGSFEIQVEKTQSRTVRLLAGIHHDLFRWRLGVGESFTTPEAVMVYGWGARAVTHNIHRLVADTLSPGSSESQWSPSKPRPILVNSWEAMYFDCSLDKIIRQLVIPARQLGIDMVVLDDGWFGRRDNDSTSLGDWTVNSAKFPGGLGALADAVENEGLQLGIWMEPEMVSPDSDLLLKHPDWTLQVPGRPSTQSRNQLVLDLTRADVREFIVSTVTRVLTESRANYLKWDFNRHLTEVGSTALPASQQSEVYHRWIMGLYDVWHRVTSTHPHVLFESCAGGGGRFDLAMMYFTPQIWTSDNTDALARIPIQLGTGLFYPATVMASHVSAVPNHQLHRSTGMMTRHVIAMSGQLGYELNLESLRVDDKSVIRELISMYRSWIRPLVLTGDLYRLSYADGAPGDIDAPEVSAWQHVSKDRKQAVVFGILSSYYELVVRPERLKLQGLDALSKYRVRVYQQEWSKISVMQDIPAISGASLMQAGLVVKWRCDADSVIVQVEPAT